MTENIFDVMICEKVGAPFRWDALWRVWQWFCCPSEGHGMGAMFAEQLAAFAELPHAATSSAKVEFKITSDMGSQWIDMVIGWPDLTNPNCLIGFEDLGAKCLKDARKKRNLQSYLSWLNGRASVGSRHRLLVVTNAFNLEAVEASIDSYLGSALASSEASVG